MSNANTELLIKIKADLGNVVADLNKVAAGIEGNDKAAQKTQQSFSAMSEAVSSTAKLFTGFFAADKAKGLIKGIIDTNAEMETLRAQLKNLTGDGERSFRFIQDFATNTPFEIEGLTKTFITLKNFGIEPTTEVMDALTNQAAVLGGSQETLSGITLALGQAYAKGKLQAEEMNQLIERGVPIYKLLAEVTGLTTAKLQDMAQKGELTRDVIDKVINKMGEMSSGGNAAAMDTLKGKISNLSDAWHTWEDTLLNDKSEGLIKGFVSSVTTEINLLTRNMSSELDAQIAHAEARIKNYHGLSMPVKAFGYIGSLGQYDIADEERKLADLKEQKRIKDAADAKVAAEKKAELENEKALGRKADLEQKAADAAEEAAKKAKKAAESKAESAAKAYASEREAMAKNIDQLKFELAVLELSDNERAIQIKLRGLSAKATDEERAAIEADIRALDKKTAAIQRQQAMWDQLVKDANAADERRSANADLIKFGDVQGGFNDALVKTREQLDQGLISPEQFKAEADKLGKAYNDYFIDPAKSGTSSLSEFSVQAARNMQSAFADFLFDPFQNGLDGMAANFAKIVQRMVAEAASAQIFETLLGKNYGQSNATGGLLSALFSGVAGAIGGAFSGGSVSVASGNSASFVDTMNSSSFWTKHTGGIIGQGGGRVSADPAIFSSATRYHSGGIAGLKPDEMPTILLKGEEVLTESDPRHRKNLTARSSDAGINITTQVNVSTNSGNSSDNNDTGNKLGNMINAAVRQVIVTEKRPGGLLAQGG